MQPNSPAQGKLGEIEQLLLNIACGEYLQQVAGGIPMNQTEIFRVGNLGIDLNEPFAAAFSMRKETPAKTAPASWT